MGVQFLIDRFEGHQRATQSVQPQPTPKSQRGRDGSLAKTAVTFLDEASYRLAKVRWWVLSFEEPHVRFVLYTPSHTTAAVVVVVVVVVVCSACASPNLPYCCCACGSSRSAAVTVFLGKTCKISGFAKLGKYSVLVRFLCNFLLDSKMRPFCLSCSWFSFLKPCTQCSFLCPRQPKQSFSFFSYDA